MFCKFQLGYMLFGKYMYVTYRSTANWLYGFNCIIPFRAYDERSGIVLWKMSIYPCIYLSAMMHLFSLGQFIYIHPLNHASVHPSNLFHPLIYPSFNLSIYSISLSVTLIKKLGFMNGTRHYV